MARNLGLSSLNMNPVNSMRNFLLTNERAIQSADGAALRYSWFLPVFFSLVFCASRAPLEAKQKLRLLRKAIAAVAVVADSDIMEACVTDNDAQRCSQSFDSSSNHRID